MIDPFAETAGLLAGATWAFPGFATILTDLGKYLGSAWPMWALFAIGIFLGRLWSRRKKSAVPEPESAKVEPVSPETEAVAVAENDDRETRRQVIAKLEGELSTARNLGQQQRQELDSFQERFDLVCRQLDEKQNRFARLSESLEKAASQPAGEASLAHARACVIHLDEVVRQERRHISGGLAQLKLLEDRLTGESERLWHSAEKVATIQERIGKMPAAKEGSFGDFVRETALADEQLRVFHQNVQGCLQRIAGSISRLQSEEWKLEQASQPIADGEAALAALAALEDRTNAEAINLSFSQALSRLSESRPHVDSLENGIDQEIAELNGRIDWVVKDSPKNFLKALDDLGECETPEDSGADEETGEVWRLLIEAKGAIAGIEQALISGASRESDHGCGKRSIVEALDLAVKTLESAAAAPSVPAEPPESEGTIAHLERQLALRESESERLERELQMRCDELRQLREEKEKRSQVVPESALSAGETASENFVRRLLGLSSGAPSAETGRGPAFSSAGTDTAAVTLAEAKEILGELKLASTNESGNGAHAQAPEHESGNEDTLPASAEFPGAPEADSELVRLREKTARQKSRINELERTIAQLRSIETGFGLGMPPPSPTFQQSELESFVEPAKTIPAIEGITPGDQVDPPGHGELVVFRGNDLGTWDSEYQGSNGKVAIPLDQLPEDIRYLRMRRIDNGDSVVIPITRNELLRGATADGPGYGWSGKRERYFGSDHFGIYDESLPRDVETKFGSGGWGFGHIESIGSEQAYGWAGRRIGNTGFEISIGTEMAPEIRVAPVKATRDPGPEILAPGEGLIIFRGNNPMIWNENTYSGANSRSRRIEELPENIRWIRIRQLPGGESVILPVTKDELTKNADGAARGFNGTNEFFYGAHHLGAFDDSLPQEVETRFTYGGWGFGHRPSGPEKQACAWEGRAIDDETVFEFTVYSEMPGVDGLLDRVLEA